MTTLKKLWRTATDIRGELGTGWRLFLGFSFILVLLFAYVRLSHKQHEINPNDKTIPTMTQIWVGVVNVVEPLKQWRNKWDIENAPQQMWPTYDNLVDGCARMFALENHEEVGKYGQMETKRAIVDDSLKTIERLFWGLLYGTLIGFLIGLHMGSFTVIEALLLPAVSFMTKIPATAAMAIFFVLSKGDQALFRDIIAFGIAPSMAMSIHLAVKEIPIQLIQKGHTLGASKLEIIWRIILPTVLPKVIDTIRLMIGPALVFLIPAEMLVSDVGIGYRIRLEQKRPVMAIVYFYLVYLAVFGLVIDKILKKLQVWMCPWTVPEKERGGPAVWWIKLRKRFGRSAKGTEVEHA